MSKLIRARRARWSCRGDDCMVPKLTPHSMTVLQAAYHDHPSSTTATERCNCTLKPRQLGYDVPMCSHYQGIKERERYIRQFGVEPPDDLGKYDLWPGYLGSFVRRHPLLGVGDEAVTKREALNGLFGLVPHWATETAITKHTYNARSETVAEKPSFRDAWKRGQHCIIPADAIFEPYWRSGKAVATRIARKDGEPLGIAGLWSCWKSPKGDVLSYTMLTITADAHDLMRQFHKPGDEKRMVVILEPDRYASWLSAPSDSSMDFMQPYPANLLTASAPTPIEGALF